jgi:hypothetical protein
MVSLNIKLSVQKASVDTVSLAVKLNGEKKIYDAKIVDKRGLFGVEFPSELNLLLQQFPAETKQLVGEIRKRFVREKELRAA